MKQTYLVLFSIFFYFSAVGQIVNIDTVKPTYRYKAPKRVSTQNEYQYTVGMELFSIKQLPKLLKQTNSAEFYNSSLSGLMLKINDNQISYRIFTDFINQQVTFRNECADCEVVQGRINDYALKFGFEKNITYSRLQPYFGGDIGFKRNKFKGSAQNAGTINFTSPYNVTTEKNGGILTPFIGLKFNVMDHFTLSAESAFAFIYSYETQEKMYMDAARTRTFQKYNKWEFLLNPLNILSLQYNFGSINQ